MEHTKTRTYNRNLYSMPKLLLGGIRYHGTAAEMKSVHAAFDRVAQAMEEADPIRYPAGTGRARAELMRRLRAAYDTSVTPEELAEWLTRQR